MTSVPRQAPGRRPSPRAGLPLPWRDRLLRWAGLFLVWIALAGIAPLDLAVGALAAALGAWASLALLPPTDRRLSSSGLAHLALRLPGQTLHAGIEVARHAFAHPLRLRPGFATCPNGLPAGNARAAFRALMSMQPGSLPVAEAADGTLLVHGLDATDPLAAQYARDEALFAAAIGGTGTVARNIGAGES